MAHSSVPNILLIMADQLIPMLTGAYGHPVVQTPNLNRLAAEGIRFEAAYSPCPVCAPARAALMTGQYISTIGAWDNGAPLACDQPTLAHYLTLAGYDTALAGKMHFVGPDQLHGFARRFNHNIYPAGFEWTPERGLATISERTHAMQYLGEAVRVGRWSDFLSYDEETHLRGLEYLRAQGEKQRAGSAEARQPFFLCVSYHHPHEPFWPPQAFWDLYAAAPVDVPELPPDIDAYYSTLDRWLNTNHGLRKAPGLYAPESMRRVRRAYYALVSYIDSKVGVLLDALHETGLAQNTLVVFTSDHGDMLLERGMVQKRTFYEWSARIPLIVRFPDGRGAGNRRGEPVNLIDLFPTLLDVGGVPLELRLPVDGRSLLPLLEEPGEEERFTFCEYHSQGAHAPCFMVRRGSYKYTYIHGCEDALYDLEDDPGEWRNRAGEPAYQTLVAQLRGLILDRFDPPAIDARIEASLARRRLIRAAMAQSGVRWDVNPRLDASFGAMAQVLRPVDLSQPSGIDR